MKIGIIGKGFVGNALFEGMCHAVSIGVYDKAKGVMLYRKDKNMTQFYPDNEEAGFRSVVEFVEGNPIFVCVPTPMKSDGSCDTSIVESVVGNISAVAKAGQIVTIKSTVPPGTTEKLGEKYGNLVMTFNPEFLTERNAIEDFKNQDRIIIGGPREGTNVLKQIYETAYPNVPVTKTSATIAEAVKYTTNCFLAVKVAFANELKLVCDALGEDYDKVVEYATKDKRLGSSHWAVPGPDGKRGFGGSCFPKDLNAMMALCRELDVQHNAMRGAWETNLAVRPEKDWEQLIGRAVSSDA